LDGNEGTAGTSSGNYAQGSSSGSFNGEGTSGSFQSTSGEMGTSGVVYSSSESHTLYHNHITVTFNGNANSDWLINCPTSNIVDSPEGCSTTPQILAKNNTTPQICSRKCRIDDISSFSSMRSPIYVEVFEKDEHHSAHAKCKIHWGPGKFLVGYDLKVHYVWIENVKTPFIQVIKCDAIPIESETPLKAGDMFTSSRQLILEGKMDFVLGVVSFVMLVLVIALSCCLLTCCLACLCMRCFGGKAALRRRCCRQRANCGAAKAACNAKAANAVEMQEVTGETVIPQNQPYAYFVLSPYTMDNSEQTFVPSAPQETQV